jgi:hypothetical protein
MSKMKVFDFNFNLSPKTGEEVEVVDEVNPLLRQIPDIENVSIDKYGRVFYRDKIIRLFV